MFKNRHRKASDDLNDYLAMGIALVDLLSEKPEQPKKALPILVIFFHSGTSLDTLQDFSKASIEYKFGDGAKNKDYWKAEKRESKYI